MTITLEGQSFLIDRLDTAIRKIGSARPLLAGIGTVLEREYDRQFDSEGRRLDRRGWTPLTAETIRDRIRSGFRAWPILQRTGSLKKSLSVSVRKDELRLSNTSRYYRYHQLGEGNNPRRRMLGMNDRSRKLVLEQVTKFIHEALNGK